jgi:hypothetical protein
MSNGVRFTARRSPIRQLLMAAAGLLLLLAAVDIVWLHELSDPPTTGDDGVLTSKGQTERRTDIVWGTLFGAAGIVLVFTGFGGLLAGRPIMELTDDEIWLRVAGPGSSLGIPWSEVVSVRSGRDYDDDGRIPIPVLLVEVADPTRYPLGLWGAEWEGNVLKVDADGWEVPVEDVVIRSELLMERAQAVIDSPGTDSAAPDADTPDPGMEA